MLYPSTEPFVYMKKKTYNKPNGNYRPALQLHAGLTFSFLVHTFGW